MMQQSFDRKGGTGLSGFLKKQGVKGPIRTWKKRWFKIEPGSRFFHYYRHPDDNHTLGSIDLCNIHSIQPSQTFSSKKDKKEFPFEVVTERRIYSLMAKDQKTRDQWIEGLTDLVSKVQDGGHQPIDMLSVPEELRDQIHEEESLHAGQLFIRILEAVELPLPNLEGECTIHCALSLDKQQDVTQMMYIPPANRRADSAVQWNEAFFFDISDVDFEYNHPLKISLWVQDLARTKGFFIGQLEIPVTSVAHGKPIDQVFPLNRDFYTINGPCGDSGFVGKLHIKLLFTRVAAKKVGIEDFEKLCLIGKGGYGKVYKVKKKDTGRIYAMKVLKKKSVIAANAVKHTMTERNVMRKMSHPFVVGLRFSFQTESELCLVMDYQGGGELFSHMTRVDQFDESRSRFYIAEVLLSIEHLHKQGIIYRDLKPENFVLDLLGHVHLTDFGLVKEGMLHDDDLTFTFCGSPEYLAPEVLNAVGYGKEIDWWAMGTLLYEMIEGIPPFYDESRVEMNKKIMEAPLLFSEMVSADAKSLLRGLLQREPRSRLGTGANGASDIKAHPFFKSIQWDRLYNKEIQPPFQPHLTDLERFHRESAQFDDSSRSPDSPTAHPLTVSKQNLFEGFSYVSAGKFEKFVSSAISQSADGPDQASQAQPNHLRVRYGQMRANRRQNFSGYEEDTTDSDEDSSTGTSSSVDESVGGMGDVNTKPSKSLSFNADQIHTPGFFLDSEASLISGQSRNESIFMED